MNTEIKLPHLCCQNMSKSFKELREYVRGFGTYPGDTIRRQMQSNGMGGKDKLYRTSWHCLSSIWKREGITGMFRGLPINVFRAIPGSAIQFATYGKLKEMLEL